MNKLKQFKVSDYFDKLFKLIATKNFLKYFGIFSLIYIPYFIVFYLLFNKVKIFNKLNFITRFLIYLEIFIIKIIYMFPFIFFTPLFVYMFYKSFFNKECSLKKSFKTVNNKIFIILLLFIYYTFITNFPFSVLNYFIPEHIYELAIIYRFYSILVSIIWIFYNNFIRVLYCFFIIFIVLEQKRLIDKTIRRTIDMAFKFFWKNFLLILFLTLFELAIYKVFVYISLIIKTLLGYGSFLDNINSVATAFMDILLYSRNFLLFWPGIAFYLLIYINQKIRLEESVVMMVDDYIKPLDNKKN